MTDYIQQLQLEDVIGDRFGRYSKYVIQDRAIPDVRDGLKPVQKNTVCDVQRGQHIRERVQEIRQNCG